MSQRSTGRRLNTVEERIRAAVDRRNPVLDLSGLELRELPESIAELTHLRILDVSNNRLAKLPEWIEGMHELESLFAYANEMTEFPRPIRELRGLEWLRMGDNSFASIPYWIEELMSLKGLFLNHCHISDLPDSIGLLPMLEELDLAYNELTSVPHSIGMLRRLRELDLSSNALTTLPEELRQLRSLKRLFVHGNSLLGLPPEILGANREDVFEDERPAKPSSILGYYFKAKQSQRPLNEAKLILVGRGGVGKTSLVNRLLRDTFKPSEAMTEGIQISSWNVRLRGDGVRLHVWDFGGQEILHATHQFFLTQRSLYLLVLSGRESTEDQDVEYWLRMIESFGAGSPVIVVLNKMKERRFDVNRRALQAKYPAIRGFVATDCASNNGIRELRELIMSEADRLENLRMVMPAQWFEIKDRLSDPRKTRKNYLSFSEFRKLCKAHGEADAEAMESLAGHLHQLGVALNYKDDPRLQDTHVLNPRWVTNGIYKVLSSQLLAAQHGILQLEDMGNILEPKEYPPKMHRFLLDLMKKFELCFTFPDNDARYLIPELLDKQEPLEASSLQHGECLNFQYHYPVLPEGLIPRFIVRTHVLSEGLQRWRTGAILQFEGNRALVKGDAAEKKVFISIAGPVKGRRRLLAIIRSDFEHIHRDIPKLEPKEMIPIPGHPDVVIPYEKLRVLEENNETELKEVIGKSIVKVNVQDLLDGVDLPSASAAGRFSASRQSQFMERPLRVFYSYSHKDDALRNKLETHLKILQRRGLVTSWSDRMIEAGDDWKAAASTQLEQADIILFLISADFMADHYEGEMTAALERHEKGEAVVIPILVREVNWKDAPFSKLQVLPKNQRAVSSWEHDDAAWSEVSEGIERKVEDLRKKRLGL